MDIYIKKLHYLVIDIFKKIVTLNNSFTKISFNVAKTLIFFNIPRKLLDEKKIKEHN